MTACARGKRMCVSVVLCVSGCVCSVLTGGEKRAGKVLRRIIMHNLRRVHTGDTGGVFVCFRHFLFPFFSFFLPQSFTCMKYHTYLSGWRSV